MHLAMPWPHRELSPNARIHWGHRARLRKTQRALWAALACQQGAARLADAAVLRLTVALTFRAPDRRARDLDNLLGACKAGLDGLADVLGVDDSRWALQVAMGAVDDAGSAFGGLGHVRVEVAPC